MMLIMMYVSVSRLLVVSLWLICGLMNLMCCSVMFGFCVFSVFIIWLFCCVDVRFFFSCRWISMLCDVLKFCICVLV